VKEPIPVTYMPAERAGECTSEDEFGGFRKQRRGYVLGIQTSLPTGSDKRACADPDGCLGHGEVDSTRAAALDVWRSDGAGGPECTAPPQAKFLVELAAGAKRTVERGLLGRHSTPDEAGGHLSAHSDSLRQCRK
jgi:hypothetical protein